MPQLPALLPGIYKIQRPKFPGAPHAAILFIGEWDFNQNVDGDFYATVADLAPGGPRHRWFNDDGEWTLVSIVPIEEHEWALKRLQQVWPNASYDRPSSNCQHFANYVTRGEWKSESVGLFKTLACIGVIAFLASGDE